MAGEGEPREFGLSLTLHGPGRGPNGASLVKPLFDGVISAFHPYAGPADLGEVSNRLGRSLAVDPRFVLAHLTDESSAVLEPRPVIQLRGSGVAWSPADERCAAGELLIKVDPSRRSGCSQASCSRSTSHRRARMAAPSDRPFRHRIMLAVASSAGNVMPAGFT